MNIEETAQTTTDRPQQKQMVLIRSVSNFFAKTKLFVETGWLIKSEGGFFLFSRPKFLFEDMYAGKAPHPSFVFITDLPEEETLASAEILQDKAAEIINDILIEYVCGNRTLITFSKPGEEGTKDGKEEAEDSPGTPSQDAG